GSKVMAVWTRVSLMGGVGGDDVMALLVDPTPNTLAPTAATLVTAGANLQRGHSVATDGKIFLVVWEDGRDLATTGLDVYAQRVGLDGPPIDAAPFLVSTDLDANMQPVAAAGDQFQPVAAAAVGGDFLVVWTDGRTLLSNNQGEANIWAARVGAQG